MAAERRPNRPEPKSLRAEVAQIWKGRPEAAFRMAVTAPVSAPGGDLPAHELRDAAHGDPAVLLFRRLDGHLQEGFAVALRHEVLRRDAVVLRQDFGDRLRPAVGEVEIVLVRPDRVGMA